MKKEIAELWVKALRSGEFEQGKYKLCENGKHCCLGVLSDLALVEGVCEYSVTRLLEYNHVFNEYGKVGKSKTLCDEVINWSGMKSDYGTFECNSIKALTDLNDSGEYDFNQIADVIEQNWEKL